MSKTRFKKLRNVLSCREDWIEQRKWWGQGCPNDPVVDRGIWSIEERKNILVKAVNCVVRIDVETEQQKSNKEC